MTGKRHSRKGITVIELVLTLVAMALIMFTADRLLLVYSSFFKEIAGKRELGVRNNIAMMRVIENVQNSAWLEIPDSDTLVLHSHSTNDIRSYSLEQGKIIYRERMSQKKEIVMTDVESDRFFEGFGYKREDKVFSMVRIKFWAKGYPHDISYAAAGAKEAWYVDYISGSAGVKLVQDGTKDFPYDNLQKAFSGRTASLESRPRFVLASSGEHVLSEEKIGDYYSILFMPDAKLTIAPGAGLSLGKQTKITAAGGFSCNGNNSYINISSGGKIKDAFKDSWSYILVTNENTPPVVYDVGYMSISGGFIGMAFASFLGPNMSVSVANSRFVNNRTHLLLRDVNIGDFTNNILSNASAGIVAKQNNYYARGPFWAKIPVVSYCGTGDFAYTFSNNTFISDTTGIYLWLTGVTDTSKANIANISVTIDKNIFTNNSNAVYEGLDGYVKVPVIRSVFSNNRVESTSSGIYVPWCLNTDIAVSGNRSRLEFNNNTFSGISNYVLCTYIDVLPVYFANNRINNAYTGILHSTNNDYYTHYKQTVVIKNNIMSNCAEPINAGRLNNYANDRAQLNIINNVLYGRWKGEPGIVSYQGYSSATGGFTSGKSHSAILENNTFQDIMIKGDPDKINVRNCIITGASGTEYVGSDILQKVTDSYVGGQAPFTDPDWSEEPKFKTGSYELQSGSKCADLGRDASGTVIEAGAYGGQYAADWSKGVGAPETGIGSDLKL